MRDNRLFDEMTPQYKPEVIADMEEAKKSVQILTRKDIVIFLKLWIGLNSEFTNILNNYVKWYNEKRLLGYISSRVYRHGLGVWVVHVCTSSSRTTFL